MAFITLQKQGLEGNLNSSMVMERNIFVNLFVLIGNTISAKLSADAASLLTILALVLQLIQEIINLNLTPPELLQGQNVTSNYYATIKQMNFCHNIFSYKQMIINSTKLFFVNQIE